ncbi:MAG TPA: hypothetical protein VG099_07170 [Gemmataceae bacterium]|jgi:hypothetical protein|nr:hypothetical protein [Gemmataceae bacterium]
MFMSKLRTVTMVLMISVLVGGAGLFCGTQAAEQGKQGPTANGSATAREAALPDREAELGELSGTNALPSGPMPGQALVSLDKGKLAVRTLSVYYEPITVAAGGKTRTTYQKAEILKTMHYDTEMVKVYDVKGKRLSTKNLPELLKKETVALAATDAQAADPLNLRLFKEGTLLFILPPSLAQPVPTAVLPPAPVEAPITPPSGAGNPAPAQNYQSLPAEVPIIPPSGAIPPPPYSPGK